MQPGIRITDDDVPELGWLLDDPLSTRLLDALERRVVILALTITDREEIPRGLEISRRLRSRPFAECCSRSTKGAWREGLV